MIREANMIWQYVDTESGLIMPWYTLPMLEWLKKQKTKEWQVFEYGCGYSTIWWRANCGIVESVDSNRLWAQAVEADFYYTDTDSNSYPRACRLKQIFDCIIVDGIFREECVNFCFDKIKPAGFLIIDNWGQEDFLPDACARTEKLLAGWSKQIFKQPNHSKWQTALFQKPR